MELFSFTIIIIIYREQVLQKIMSTIIYCDCTENGKRIKKPSKTKL